MKTIAITFIMILGLSQRTVHAQRQVIQDNLAVEPKGLCLMNLDGDGYPDPVYGASYWQNTFSFFQNSLPDTNFLFTRIVNDSVYLAATFQHCDVDGDGDDDIVFNNYDTLAPGIATLINADGAGTTWELNASIVPDEDNTIKSTADIEGDGDIDLIEYNNLTGDLFWRENMTGTGDFADTHLIAAAIGALTICVMDADGNYTPDIIALSDYNKITTLLNFGGSFIYGPEKHIVYGMHVLDTGDMDADGDNDLLAGGGNDAPYPSLIWYKNLDGAGTFGDSIVVNAGTYDYYQIGVADISGDGLPDVFASGENAVDMNKLFWWQNSPGGIFSSPVVLYLFESSPIDFALGDGDADGDIDLFNLQYDQIAFTENTGSSPWLNDAEIVSPPPYYWYDLAVQDLDNDNDVDVVAHTLFSDLYLYHYDAALSQFSEADTILKNTVNATSSKICMAADINNDSLPEIFINRSYGGTYHTEYLKNLGGDVFADPIELNSYSVNNIWEVDMDNDGDKDLVMANTFGYASMIYWQYNLDGAGTFGTTYSVTPIYNSYKCFCLTDVDNDGDQDLIGYSNDYTDWGFYIFRYTAGNFSTEESFVTSICGATGMVPYDFDFDGDEDVVYACYAGLDDAQYVHALVHTGAAYSNPFAPIGTLAVHENGADYFDIKDLDGDGFSDFIYSSNYNSPAEYTNATNFTKGNVTGFGSSINYGNEFGVFTHVDDPDRIDFIGYNTEQIFWEKNAVLHYPSFTAETGDGIISEDGVTDTLQLKFTSVPAVNVDLKITPDSEVDLGAGPGMPVYHTFLADSTALVPVNIIITAFDDAVEEYPAYVTVSTQIISDYSPFNEVFNNEYYFYCIDNDVAPALEYFFSPTAVKEGGNTSKLNIAMKTIPQLPVYVNIEPDAQLFIGAGMPDVLTFMPDTSAFNNQFTIIHATDDVVYEGDHTGHITLHFTSDDPVYGAFADSVVQITIIDNDAPSAIQQENNASISIEPNPADNLVHIRWDAALMNGEIKIFDESGHLVYTQLTDAAAQVDLTVEKWKPGIYTIKIFNGTSVVISKLIVV